MRTIKAKTMAVVMALVLGCASVGLAIPMPPNALGLKLSDGINPALVVFDGSPLDTSWLPGVVTYNGFYAGWMINVSTGIGQPEQGNPVLVNMDLNSVNRGVGVLWVELWNAPYSPGTVTLISGIGGTTDGTVMAYVYNDAAQFGHAGGPVITLGTFAPGAFSGTGSATGVNIAGGYTEQVVITHRVPGTTSFNMTLKQNVPDGGLTVTMLGIALAGLGIIRRRLSA